LNVSVIIPVQDEEQTFDKILTEVKKLNPYEIIVVANGSKDRTKEIARLHSCTIISFEEPLGNDVGRAIGAKHATGDIILFLDGDIIIPYKQLLPFINALKKGYDISLNNLSFLAYQKTIPHYTTVSKLAINNYLQQIKLSLNSILAVPHAIKREVIDKIGWKNLADPILTQAIAVTKGLSICAPAAVDVINTNRIRPVHKEKDSSSVFPITTSRIIGDHLRAISYLSKVYGKRGRFPKVIKSNDLPNYSLPMLPANKKAKISGIIIMTKENQKILPILTEVKLAGADEIILVAHKVSKETIQQARAAGTIVIEYNDDNFHPYLARLVGVMHSSAEICLFLSGEQMIMAKNLKPFLLSIENGADIVVNNRKMLLDSYLPTDTVSTGQYFVNMALNRPDLFNNGLTFYPHAIRKNLIEKIGFEDFIVPPLAQAKALLLGYKVQVVSKGIYLTRINEDKVTSDQILGDQIEALGYLIRLTNERGGFYDGGRKREFLHEDGNTL
jgi:glycosyltransferase involved in cell wall biosynthesis